MAGGLVPLLIAIVLLFTNMGITNQTALFFYVVITFCVVNTAYSLIFIPYYAAGAELTYDYHERTSLLSYRMFVALIGNVVGSVLALPLINLFPNRNTGFTWMAVIMWILIAITVMITFFTIKEPKHIKEEFTKRVNLLKVYISALNRPFVIFLITMTLYFISLVMFQGAVAYFFKYVYGNEGMAVVGILAYAIASIAFIPLVGVISRKIGKKRAWILGLLLNIIGGIILFLSPSVGGLPVSFIGLVIIGIGGAFSAVLAGAIAPDIMEYDYLLTDERREGVFSGLAILVQQIGLAIGSASVGWILGAFGYKPDVTQSSSVLLGIRFAIALMPAILNIIGIFVLLKYPITEAVYKEIREKIEMREQTRKETGKVQNA
jgi:GPH family glycoside/pentoside/hexuronide:cation symporter